MTINNVYARLHPGSRDQHWHVQFDGEVIAVNTRNPRQDTEAHLAARGITGTLILVNAHTGRPILGLEPVGSSRRAEETSRHATTPDTVPAA